MVDLEQKLKEEVLASHQKTIEVVDLMQQYLSTPAKDRKSRHTMIDAIFSAYKSVHETLTLAKVYNRIFYDEEIKEMEKRFDGVMTYTEDTVTDFYKDIRDVIEDHSGNDKGY